MMATVTPLTVKRDENEKSLVVPDITLNLSLREGNLLR
jgi:hypothetical protein